MNRITSGEHSPYVSESLWTGRMEMDLTNSRGQWVGTVEVVVRLDDVSLWYGNRTLAVIDRLTFREWLIRPDLPFGIDDVVWVMLGTATCLTIDGSAPYSVAADAVTHLVSVI